MTDRDDADQTAARHADDASAVALLRCGRCERDLAGVLLGGRCPACGHPVQSTIAMLRTQRMPRGVHPLAFVALGVAGIGGLAMFVAIALLGEVSGIWWPVVPSWFSLPFAILAGLAAIFGQRWWGFPVSASICVLILTVAATIAHGWAIHAVAGRTTNDTTNDAELLLVVVPGTTLVGIVLVGPLLLVIARLTGRAIGRARASTPDDEM